MQPVQAPSERQIADMRRFNRFYTRQIGVLEEGMYKSEFSLTEARVLFELAHRDRLTASVLGNDLGLDAGYLSRMLKKFERHGLLKRQPSTEDGRQSHLTLTEEGRRAFEPLDRAARDLVEALLAPLPAADRETLTAAMRTVERLLGPAPEREAPYALRPLRVGDIGWIIHRQGLLYHQEYGWDESYEALVAEILSAFVTNCDPRFEASWIAECDGEIVGSVFVVRASEETAKLRLLYVEPAARGLGIGRRLVDECIGFARAKDYKRLTLWTNDILVSARRIYQAAGFRLEKEEPHHSFGKDLVGQTWTFDL
ncbi:bifunctional helix-turn-helix transcriptional regulator/GNAT family N-acetyltransferase [Chelativorans salis]|uniref:Bifunctional helix-turn-helix transcriptional regulator/GNAT family N-acetyltransferase n=1 Tax=Chelativorans salis TaxID=2978478 RepID=A0ABT2LKS9_9HYPH|nr:bifunctional helix-turn-helix transcriptional regulator/GNAT family N-acetyltransferase [Chelativorans sp. EGI FJ00035]MCT7374881.1 bifunctional helix-turn-helix transcriptional regulator/GNAT family N-acetyltransferase [Chelativorans sp. EGI FJ00035]